MTTFFRLLKLIGPFRGWLILGVLLSAATSGASVGLLAVSAYLISKAAISTTLVDLSLIITGVRFFAISRAALRYAERYINHKATFRILTGLRVWFYRAVEPLAPAGLGAHHSGDLLARIVADIETLENFYLRVLIPPLAAALVTAVACTILGSFDLRLALALLLFVLLTGVVLPLATRYLSRHAALDVIALRADLNVALLDGVQGMADLLAYGQETAQDARVTALSAALHAQQERLARIRGLSSGLGVLFTGLAAITVLGLAAPLVYAGQIEGVFLALLPLTALAAFEAVQPLSQSLQWLAVSQSAAARIFAVIDAPPAISEPPAPPAIPAHLAGSPVNGSASTGTHARRSPGRVLAPPVQFEHVHFRYAAGEPWVLDDFTLHIPAGSTCGIAGPNGSGKSTLAHLLLRFWDYTAGSIRIDGVELRDLPSDDARALFSVVPQHTHLFNATIRANLHVVNPDATDAQLAAACRQAELHNFIAGLPNGYDTMIGENGFRLSGGERQRLAIARAVLKAAPILILDEATSQLDLRTESALLASLRPFIAGRTTLIISHREAPLQGLDQVVQLGSVAAISSAVGQGHPAAHRR
jgi:thiol reductant ABC exporter CydC subunit